uniref:Uncharacterized protein n=1 Tax=Caudovirales sp. ctNZz8 TaxID=2826772 RepID=A0A8S5QYQ2_9CAUD|nr:MAG TPA: hypothetical protein [Caudovirales sp. ctNZz8]
MMFATHWINSFSGDAGWTVMLVIFSYAAISDATSVSVSVGTNWYSVFLLKNVHLHDWNKNAGRSLRRFKGDTDYRSSRLKPLDSLADFREQESFCYRQGLVHKLLRQSKLSVERHGALSCSKDNRDVLQYRADRIRLVEADRVQISGRYLVAHAITSRSQIFLQGQRHLNSGHATIAGGCFDGCTVLHNRPAILSVCLFSNDKGECAPFALICPNLIQLLHRVYAEIGREKNIKCYGVGIDATKFRERICAVTCVCCIAGRAGPLEIVQR